MTINGFSIEITRVRSDHYRADVYGTDFDEFDSWADFATHAEAKAWAVNYASNWDV